MTIFVDFLKRLTRHHETCPVQDLLLRDIGVSRFFSQFP